MAVSIDWGLLGLQPQVMGAITANKGLSSSGLPVHTAGHQTETEHSLRGQLRSGGHSTEVIYSGGDQERECSELDFFFTSYL